MFEIGAIIKYEGVDYEIIEVPDINTVKVKPIELDIMGKNIIEDYMKQYDVAEAIARWFISMKKITHGYMKSVRCTKLTSAIKAVEQLIRLDNYSPAVIIKVLNNSMKDSFWSEIAKTLPNIRNKWFDKLYSNMIIQEKHKKIDDVERMILTKELT